jgi:hypothetical protein
MVTRKQHEDLAVIKKAYELILWVIAAVGVWYAMSGGSNVN